MRVNVFKRTHCRTTKSKFKSTGKMCPHSSHLQTDVVNLVRCVQICEAAPGSANPNHASHLSSSDSDYVPLRPRSFVLKSNRIPHLRTNHRSASVMHVSFLKSCQEFFEQSAQYKHRGLVLGLCKLGENGH